jgi:hypothetical protein|nr:MAG TPA: protein of unknown function (DUF5320) [Caudoviricetes sp.]
MSNLETLKQQTADLEAKLKEMKAEIDRLENGWEMKCPYKDGDDYWFLFDDGNIDNEYWCDCLEDDGRFKIGNTFPTEKEASLESKRRNLLTRFRAFRNECNGDWKFNWRDGVKWLISYDITDGLTATCTIGLNDFTNFGYFENKQDALRAIDLFGDEIKELFVEEN